jgi:hypothetical protein
MNLTLECRTVPVNIRLTGKNFQGTKVLAYLAAASVSTAKSLKALALVIDNVGIDKLVLT